MSGVLHGLVNASNITRDAAFVDTYSNSVRVSVTLGDISIVFSVNDDQGLNNVVVKDRVAMHVAPTTLKVLAVMLSTVVEAYEEAVGEIKTASNSKHQMSAMKAGLSHALKQQLA